MSRDPVDDEIRSWWKRWLRIAAVAAAVGLAPAFALEITFYQRGYVEGGQDAATRLTDAAIAAFERRHPDIRVQVVGVPWEADGDLKLRAALLARRRIDCFRLAHDQLPSFIPERGRLLAPVDPWLSDADRADFLPAALEVASHGGQVMAWPLWATAIVLVANDQLLNTYGIVPPDARPWSWPEFVSALRRVRDAGGGAVAGLNAASLPPLFEWAPLLLAHCGPLFTAAAPLPDGDLPLAPELATALRAVDALRRERLLSPTFGAADQTAAQAEFLAGRVAFLLTSPAFLRRLEAQRFSYRVLPPPTGAWGRPVTSGALGLIAVVDSGDPARVAAAHALARYLTSAEVSEDVPGWYLAPPARRSITSFYEDPTYRPLRAILPTAVYAVPPTSAGFLARTFIPGLQAAVLGVLAPELALERLQNAARRQSLPVR